MSGHYQTWAYEPPRRWIHRRGNGHRPDPRVMGDSGPWIKNIASMWQALADPTGGHSYPSAPRETDLTWPPYPSTAYWAPLPHLLRHSFGWREPSWQPGWNRAETMHMAIGLQRLLQHGPGQEWIDDPRVRFVTTVWDVEELDAFAAWAAGEYFHGSGELETASPAVRALVEGGYDPLHLGAHWDAPLEPGAAGENTSRPGDPRFFAEDTHMGPPRGLLLLDSYAAWSARLQELGNTHRSDWEIDVVVQQVGWLGTFSRSPFTGLWFSGDHALHLLGH